jgi:hypothetical protein
MAALDCMLAVLVKDDIGHILTKGALASSVLVPVEEVLC